MTLDLTATLLSAPVLAFALGALAVALRSDLRIPDAVSQGLSIYLLLAIGLKGGVGLRDADPTSFIGPLVLAVGLGLAIPVLAYLALRALTPYSGLDRGAIAAHYGSTSVVTFTAALVALESAAVAVPAYAVTMLAVVEVPGLIVGILLARRATARHGGWAETLHEVVTGKAILLLLGGLAIGAVIGPDGYAGVEPVFGDLFRGALVLFLLGLGIDAARRVSAIRQGAAGLIAFAVVFPLIVGPLTVLAASAAGLDEGGAVVLAILSASASYIAAPAAVRMALPDASPAIALTASLAVTFPVNLLVGIPLALGLAATLHG